MPASKNTDRYDLAYVRRQFPGLDKGTVCFNNGSGAAVYKGAIERHTILHDIVDTMSQPHLSFRHLDAKSQPFVKLREAMSAKLASFMNADPDEIAFGPSTTALLRSLSLSLRPNLTADSEVIVSLLCHEAGITAWVALAKALSISIKWWVPHGDNDPRHNLESLRALLSPKTRLVCCGHVSNVTGSIEPIKEIAALVHTIPEALVCVDGVAWAPHRSIDVKDLDVDFYIFSWYKAFGPHLSQLYARRRTQQRYLTSLNHYFFESTPLSVLLGLGNPCVELEHCCVPIIDYLERAVGWEAIIAHERSVTAHFLNYLASKPQLYTLYGSQSASSDVRVSLISFSANELSSHLVTDRLHELSNYRLLAGDCWSPRTVHDVLGLPTSGVIRISLVHYNTVEEVQGFIEELEKVVRELRVVDQSA